jgi:predicted DNA-binding protein YlxM (UPF0122 family)
MYNKSIIYTALRLYYNKQNNKLSLSDVISSFGFSRSRFFDRVKMYSRNIVQRKTNNPIANNKTIRNEIMKKYNTKVSRSGYFRILKNNNFTNKKIQKNKYPYSDDKFKTQKEALKKSLTECKRNVISIDETSVLIGEKPNYDMSKKGERCCMKVTNTRKRYSVLIAISRRNKVSFKVKKGSFNGETFKSFILDDVLPKIKKANLYG